MDYQVILDEVRGIVADIFERDPHTLNGTTRLMLDLPCESIDLLEIGARLGQTFHLAVEDDVVFLRSLRYHLAEGGDPKTILHREYPYLSEERRAALVRALADPEAEPQLCLDDIVAYIASLTASRQ